MEEVIFEELTPLSKLDSSRVNELLEQCWEVKDTPECQEAKNLMLQYFAALSEEKRTVIARNLCAYLRNISRGDFQKPPEEIKKCIQEVLENNIENWRNEGKTYSGLPQLKAMKWEILSQVACKELEYCPRLNHVKVQLDTTQGESLDFALSRSQLRTLLTGMKKIAQQLQSTIQ